MRLVCYINKLNEIYNFDYKYHFFWNENNEKIHIKLKSPNFENFYGEKINLTAIVGQNGSGKTHLLNSIYSLSDNDGTYVFENGNYFIYCGSFNKLLAWNEITSKEENIKKVYKDKINTNLLFFSNSLEGKNEITESLVNKVHSNLSILSKVYDTSFQQIHTESIIKQINLVHFFNEKDVFSDEFFSLPNVLSGSFIIPNMNIDITDKLLKKIVFTDDEYLTFKSFYNDFFGIEKKEMLYASRYLSISFFSSLLNLGMEIKDIQLFLGTEISKEKCVNNIWLFLNKCFELNFEFRIQNMNTINEKINLLKIIEKKGDDLIEKINQNDVSEEKLSVNEISILLKLRTNFQNSINNLRRNNNLEEIKDENVDILPIAQIVIFLWKYVVSTEMINNIGDIDINHKSNLYKFEKNVTEKDYFIDLVLLNNTILDINYCWKRLSSGENYLLNLFGELLESKKNNIDNNFDIVLFIDEVDLGLHPEWQRRWINYCPTIISKILKNENKQNLQLILTTHSPIILSDLIKDSVYLVDKTGINLESGKTFASNINELMANSFFLNEGLMGAFSTRIINEIINSMNNEEKLHQNKINMIFKIIDEIGEDFIRNSLNKNMESLGYFRIDEDIKLRREYLKNEIKRFNDELIELEKNEGEKN